MNLDEYIKEKYPKGLSYEFTPEEEAGYLAAIEDVKKALSIANVVGRSEQLPSCDKCGYYIHPENKTCLREGCENY